MDCSGSPTCTSVTWMTIPRRKLADEAGVIIFATVWRGFEAADCIHAIDIADDLAAYTRSRATDPRVSNVKALSRLILETDILRDPALMGLPNTELGLRYYGISLGGIAGAVTLANTPAIEHAVFNVGGGAWSTMLERSAQWIPFDWIMVEQILSPRDRQLLYALSQLFWDPGRPLQSPEALKGRSILWQESLGDEQVPNMTTRMPRGPSRRRTWVRSSRQYGPRGPASPVRGPAYVQYDPETERPVEANRPGVPSGAHGAIRVWQGCRDQIAHFNDAEAPGEAAHFCGRTLHRLQSGLATRGQPVPWPESPRRCLLDRTPHTAQSHRRLLPRLAVRQAPHR